jgi:hypothetical protein
VLVESHLIPNPNNGKPFNKAQKNSHGSFEVKCGSCKHDIDRVPKETLIKVSAQAVVTLAMTDYRLYTSPFPEKFMFLSPDIKRV